jgi:molybdate transport system regulatory protein
MSHAQCCLNSGIFFPEEGTVIDKPSQHLAAPLWLLFAGRELLLGKTMELLRQIDMTGSLTKAANAVPVSYKTAWDMIDRLNNISARPVVTTATGGRGGGGTRLSDYGKMLVSLYSSLERTYDSMSLIVNDSKLNDLDGFIAVMKGLCMKTSARNQLAGTVKSVITGAVNSEILIDIGDKVTVTAVITNDSVADLCLKKGVDVIVLVKASFVILFPGADKVRSTADNMLRGRVVEVRTGAVNDEVILNVRGGKTITAVVTKKSVESLGIKEGEELYAAFNASQVILALPM